MLQFLVLLYPYLIRIFVYLEFLNCLNYVLASEFVDVNNLRKLEGLNLKVFKLSHVNLRLHVLDIFEESPTLSMDQHWLHGCTV